ncbi:MAG: 4Fe-4S binding protein [Planctomycetota bacterium]
MKIVKIWMFRRGVQSLVILSLFVFPIVAFYTHYLSTRALDKALGRWDQKLQGEVLQVTDQVFRMGLSNGEGGVSTRRPRKAVLARSQAIYGSVWSAKIFGVSMTDLLAGAESLVTSRTFLWVLLATLVVPILATLLFGRVFCSWICPMGFLFEMGEKFRRFVQFLEIRPLKVSFSPSNKYILLGVGLVCSFFIGIPLLQYIYPPALLSRETQSFILTFFDRAERGRFGFALAGITGVSVFLLILLILDSLIAPRFWCRSLCPGGAIYNLLGKFRLFRVRRDIKACTPCSECNTHCPMALKPMIDRTGMECDNCGICIDVCPEKALHYKFSLSSKGYNAPQAENIPEAKPSLKNKKPLISLLFLFFVFNFSSSSVYAHHILGIPHYAYDESYPQAPVLKLIETVGRWEFQLTGYPGLPKPQSRTEIHVYISDTLSKSPYTKPIKFFIRQQNLLWSDTIIFGPVTSEITQNLYKFHPTYPVEGNYTLFLEFEDDQGPSTLEFSMVVGEPGSPWTVLMSFVGGFVFFVIVIRAIRIKKARSKRK